MKKPTKTKKPDAAKMLAEAVSSAAKQPRYGSQTRPLKKPTKKSK